ncbi:MAG TPA: hypothetical protein VNE71_01025 [Myxococcota bacterium]|nr:hypothetical protein [Myxococcota bacterium]
MARASLLAAVVAVLLAVPAHAGDPKAPLQLELSLPIATAPSGKARSVDAIEPGDATIRTVARNQRGGETVQVDLTLDYKVPKGTIALDELVERIEVETAAPGGELFQQAVIDAQLVTLNPNRAKLLYRVTLFYPTDAPTYLLRLRLFGNYE